MPLIRKGEPRPAAPDRLDAFAALSSGDADARWRAARSLSGEQGGVRALGAALRSETDPRVREAILTAMARAATLESVDLILPCLRSDDAGLRTGALDALGAMPEAVAPRLAELLTDPDPDVRLLSCELARALPRERAQPMLCALLESETQANVCAAAVDVLAEIGDATAAPVLAACASRFARDPFLGFAVDIAIQGLGER